VCVWQDSSFLAAFIPHRGVNWHMYLPHAFIDCGGWLVLCKGMLREGCPVLPRPTRVVLC